MTTPPHTAVQQWALAYADLGARHILEHYGRKIAGRLGRRQRHINEPHRQVATHNRHTVIAPPADDDLDTLLADGFAALPDGALCMRDAIDAYVRERIRNQHEHEFGALVRVVAGHGCGEDTSAA